MSQSSNIFVRSVRALWNGVDRTRRFTFNLLFLLLVVGVIVLLMRDDTPEIKESSALVIAPKGRLVEQLTGRSFDSVLDQAMGNSVEETLLKDVTDAIAAAKDDERFPVLVLNLNGFAGAGLTKLQDVGAALQDFKSSGKRVVAIADNYSMDSYYLAAHADEVIMHKMGMLAIEGMSRYRMYYKEGLDKFGIDVNVFKVGTFKSAVEPYLRDTMSDEAKLANREWMGDLWVQYLEEVGAARDMDAAAIDRYAQDMGELMMEAGGDTAQAALDYGLADQALSRIEMRQYLIDLVGEDEESKSYLRTNMRDLLAVQPPKPAKEAGQSTVAVVVARGSILDGSHPPGTIGGDSTAALIRDAREDEDVKAIILRVDSGGGSAFASEVIRRELEAAQEQGIKVIASMGTVAASGGYWISTSSDQIWAHPSTITGSIGIFAMIPTYQKPLKEYLGVQVDGISTAPLASFRPDRALPEELGASLQIMINRGYEEFLERVSAATGMSTEEVNEVAQGRVWSGEDAFRLGLVDALGDLEDAIAAAAELAELGEDYTVRYVEKELDFTQRLLSDMTAGVLQHAGIQASEATPLRAMLRDLEAQADELARFNDPNHIYAWSTLGND